MRLVRLELSGFKSFGTAVAFDIPKGITCIVGPNGSGKSNVVDAVRWLFGERANAKLRMPTSADVLYAGSQSVKRAEKASVKAFFSDGSREITVERLYNADGKNTYFLNGSPSRLKDISEIFMGTGTGRDLYSIVGQGEITQLVNSSPEQIKNLLEEAAGVAVYKARKTETLSKLKDVQENLNRLNDVISEVERTMRSLNLKSKRAKRYKEYEEELNFRKRKYFGHFFFLNSTKLKEIEEKMAGTSETIETLQKELYDLEVQFSELKEMSSSVEEEIKRFESELEKYREREKTLSNLKEMYSAKLSRERSVYVELGTKKDSMRSELDRSFGRLEELKRLINSLEEENQKFSSQLKKLEKIHSEKTDEISKSERERTEIKSRISSLTKEHNTLEVAKDKALESIKDLDQRLKVVESQLAEKQAMGRKFQDEIDRIASEESQVVAVLEEHNKKLNDLDDKRREIENTVADLRKKRDSLNSERMELSSKREILKRNVEEYSGYSRAVRTVMNSHVDGVVDVVANLIDVPKDIETAVSVLLGGRAQNIVVKNSEVAKRCVQILKRANAGRATFIPLDIVDLREPSMEASVMSAPGMIGYAFKLVKASKGYEKLVNFIFRKDLIVDSLDNAILLRKRTNIKSRIVSLDGQLLASSGTITGGSPERTDLVSHRRLLRDIESKITKISEELKKTDAKIADMEVSREIAFKEKSDLEKRLLKENLELNNSRNDRESLLSKLASLQKEVEELEKFKKDYVRRAEKAKATVDNSDKRIKEIDREISDLENKLKGDSTESLRRRQEIEKLQEEMIDLKIKINSVLERKGGYQKESSRLSKRVDEVNAEISEINANLEKTSKDIKQTQERLVAVEHDLESVRRDTEELFRRSKSSKGSRNETLKKLENLEKGVNGRRKKLEKLREQLHTLELEKVSLVSSVDDSLKELVEAGGSKDEAQIVDETELETLSSEIEEYKRKMKFLGPVDISAIEEYEGVEKRYKDLMAQKNDLEKSCASLEDVIKRTDEEARTLLVKTLDRINENFSKMISILFTEGSGYLSFVGEKDILESPVEINVKLPGKRVQKLYTLSGGERALVGLALIFSLLMITPSAFYILDEVDAALDDFSTQRFVDLLGEYSKSSNFLIMTHNKLVMEKADILYGITMVNGSSTVIPVELSEFSETNAED